MQYPTAICAHGKCYNARGLKDLVGIVRDTAGDDLAEHIEQLVNFATEEMEKAKRELESDLTAYETQMDSYRNLLSDIRDALQELSAEMQKGKSNRSKMQSIIDIIGLQIENEL